MTRSFSVNSTFRVKGTSLFGRFSSSSYIALVMTLIKKELNLVTGPNLVFWTEKFIYLLFDLVVKVTH